MSARTMERVGAWLEAQTAAWRWVDPEAFTRACVEMEVWESWTGAEAVMALRDYFDEEVLTSATLRFLNVAAALQDDTLTEFVFETDEGHTAIPTAIFWTAATTPYDDVEEAFEPCTWRRSILSVLAEE